MNYYYYYFMIFLMWVSFRCRLCGVSGGERGAGDGVRVRKRAWRENLTKKVVFFFPQFLRSKLFGWVDIFPSHNSVWLTGWNSENSALSKCVSFLKSVWWWYEIIMEWIPWKIPNFALDRIIQFNSIPLIPQPNIPWKDIVVKLICLIYLSKSKLFLIVLSALRK